jgi:Flp pilus assembly protein TadG
MARGVAAVEFALLMPILALFFVFVVDLGLGFYRTMQVQNAAAMGAQYAAVHG